MSHDEMCTIYFDGSAKGNPGRAGCGAVLRVRRQYGGVEVHRVWGGLGICTNNVAEYKGLILGLRTALNDGFTNVTCKGDSLLVVSQVMGEWRIENPKMQELFDEVMELASQFRYFHIGHFDRGYNSAADTIANWGTDLEDGEVCEDYGY